MTVPHEASVFLVGAGPGDPSLMTVRAAELLARADLVLYDQLVPKRMLDFAKADAEKVCVRDLPGKHPDKYPHIFDLMIERAQQGKLVVRLKGGDPLIFGRGGEEAEALRAAGVSYEIVPGVTAALAAAAYLEIPLTHRRQASAIALVTGHELPAKQGNKLDWAMLAKFPGTLAIYMGIARLPILVSELLKHGKDPNTPAAIVERAGTGDMRTTYAPLGTIEQARRHAGLEAPGLVIVGEVIDLRVGESWFEKKPLFGRRVLVTRPRDQAQPLMHQLERLGAVAYLLPILEVREPASWDEQDASINALIQGKYDWLITTSANGVDGLMNRLRKLDHDSRALGHVRIAVIGTKTAEAWAKHGITPDFVPPKAVRSEGFVAAFATHAKDRRILIAGTAQGRDVIREELTPVAATVDVIHVYEQVEAIDPEDDAMTALRRGEIHFVLLTSANIAKASLSSFDDTIRGRIERGEIKLITMSEHVNHAVTSHRLPVAETAISPSTSALLDALIRAVG